MTLAELSRLFHEAGIMREPVVSDLVIGPPADDSRTVRPGSVFIAVKGNAADGFDYIPEAVRRGAVAIVSEREGDFGVPLVQVSNSRLAAALAGSTWFGTAAASCSYHGVTGTNGKSTTVRLMAHVLELAWLGTLGGYLHDGTPVPGIPPLTTPGPVDLHRALALIREGGSRGVAMEVSSHALDQFRADGIPFDTGVFTNLSHEHLDYHGDLMRYLEAKLRLIELVKPGGVLVVNRDSRAWDSIDGGSGRRVVEFSTQRETDVWPESLEPHQTGYRFVLHLGSESYDVDLPLLGDFNVSNALAASAAAWASGVSGIRIAERLGTAPSVTGRMEILHSDGYLILRDYAHTAESYEMVLSSLRKTTSGRLIVVFGCGGDRDRKKRPDMARIAGRLSDLAIITLDNPRTEDPERIYSDIQEGIGTYAHMRVDDREDGIRRAVGMMESGDTLVLLGKGHETYQIMGTRKLPFDERAIIADALANRS